jgi:hypothetical protein
MSEFTDEQIQKLIKNYERRKDYQRNYYRSKYQNDPEHRELKKQKSSEYYNTHKKVKKENFEKQGDYNRAKKRYNYALKNNSINKFKLKYPEDYEKWFHKD